LLRRRCEPHRCLPVAIWRARLLWPCLSDLGTVIRSTVAAERVRAVPGIAKGAAKDGGPERGVSNSPAGGLREWRAEGEPRLRLFRGMCPRSGPKFPRFRFRGRTVRPRVNRGRRRSRRACLGELPCATVGRSRSGRSRTRPESLSCRVVVVVVEHAPTGGDGTAEVCSGVYRGACSRERSDAKQTARRLTACPGCHSVPVDAQVQNGVTGYMVHNAGQAWLRIPIMPIYELRDI